MSYDKVTEMLPLRDKKRDVVQLLVRIGNQIQLRDFKAIGLENFKEMVPLQTY